MAKRKTASEGTVTRAAVSIGSALGKAAARFDAWLEQRDAVARELTSVIGKAQGLLSSINKPAPRKAAKSAKRAKPAKRSKKSEARSKKSEVRRKK